MPWPTLKKRGLLKMGRGFKKPKGGENWVKINDPVATVHGPRTAEGSITVRGYYYYAPEPGRRPASS